MKQTKIKEQTEAYRVPDRKINREIDREQETEKQKYGGHSDTQMTIKKV